MSFNGSGVFSRSNGTNSGSTTWADDRDGGVLITATNHDTHDQDIASGLTQCVTKNGETTRTADSPMSGFKHTNVDDAAARNQYAAAGQIQDGELVWGGTSGGTANAQTITLSPAITALVTGMRISFLPGNANTGACTLDPNSVGATTIKHPDGKDLIGGELSTAYPAEILYTGTNFILLNPSPTHTTWTPTISSNGGSIGSVSVTYARYCLQGTLLQAQIRFTGTVTGTPNYLTMSKPTDAANDSNIALVSLSDNGTAFDGTAAFTTAAAGDFRIYSDSSRGGWNAGSAVVVASFQYEAA